MITNRERHRSQVVADRPHRLGWAVLAVLVTVGLAAGCAPQESRQATPGATSAPSAGLGPSATTTSAPDTPRPTGTPASPESASPESSSPESSSPESSSPESTSPGNSASTAPKPSAKATSAAPSRPASVRPPGKGDVKRTVPPRAVVTRPAVPVRTPAVVEQNLTVRIERTEAIQAKAVLPGEVSGPGVMVELVAVNKTATAIDVSTVVVDCADSTGAPCGQLTSDPAAPFTGQLAPGATAKGRYVFVLAEDRRDPASLLVTLTGDRPVVQFKGRIG